MGLDVGKKTIGVAVSDPLLLTAEPLKTIWRKKFSDDLEELKKIILKYDITKIVVGLPKNMDNSISSSAQRVISFVDLLKKNLNIDIFYQDERLTTSLSEQVLMKMNVRRENRKKYIDKIAASFILDTFLQENYNG